MLVCCDSGLSWIPEMAVRLCFETELNSVNGSGGVSTSLSFCLVMGMAFPVVAV